MILVKLMLILILLLILYQDLRFQAVSWILFLLGFAITGYIAIVENNRSDLVFHFSANLFFVFFQLSILFIYSWFKFKSIKNIFKSVYGFGDLLFLIMIIPLFSPFNFVFFFICSVLFALVLFLLLKGFKVYQKEKVPLAGFQAGFLIIVQSFHFFIPINFYNDFLILDQLNILS